VRHAQRLAAVVVFVAATVGTPGTGSLAAPLVLPPSSLSVWRAGAWHEWWRSERAPTRWSAADPALATALAWHVVAPGIERSETRLAGAGIAWRTRIVVVRVDPARVTLSLELAIGPRDGRPSWSIDRAPSDALLAFNAGQFVQAMPWGWVVLDGREHLPPGTGPASAALAIDRAGRPHWIAGDSLAASPWRRGGLRCAFQSYPTLLASDGEVAPPLRTPGHGIDLAHRDARLAIGETREGALLVVLTRFDGLGGVAGGAPVGLTSPEMAAVMGALGARDAMMLDGGISAQMTLRETTGGRRMRWPGWRKVPLAMLARPRAR